MIVLMRHGESTWNAAGRMQYQNPHPPLTERGRDQVTTTAAVLDGLVGSVVTSPAARAAESAEIVAEVLSLPLTEDPRLVELGRGETLDGLSGRVLAVVEDVLAAAPERPVLLVTHGDVIAHAARLLADVVLPLPANASAVRLVPREGTPAWALDALC